MKFYKKILDISNYILIIFQIKWSSRTYYFQGSKLLDKSCQICQTRSLCIVYDISGDTYIWILLLFKLGWKLDIFIFLKIYGRPSNLSRQERTTCLKLRLKICQEYMKIGDLGYIEKFWHVDFVFIIQFYLFI
jgi:hypothetical protein